MRLGLFKILMISDADYINCYCWYRNGMWYKIELITYNFNFYGWDIARHTPIMI